MWYLFLVLSIFAVFCLVYGRKQNSLPLQLISGILFIIISINLFLTGLDIPIGWSL